MAEVVWKPIPNTSQEMALDSRADETLYCGARGPGKTDVQLMYFRRFVGMGYGRFWRGVIFDREYKNLDDLVSKSKRWFFAFDDGARWLSSAKDYKWVWPTGEELLFRVVKNPDDYWDFHGQEFPFVGWNELTKYPTPDVYDLMKSCNRSSFTNEKDNCEVPPIPLRIFATSNPYGPGHNWVRRYFIDGAPYGKLQKQDTQIFDPKTQKEVVVTKSKVAIFGSYKENIYLPKEYIAGLNNIQDENIRKAWLEGSWDVTAGGAIDDVWRRDIHILPAFKIPANWRIDRSLDWGSTHPFAVAWWAEANGEEVLIPGRGKFAPAKGSIIMIAEWYGAEQIGLNKGIRTSAKDLAIGIKQRELSFIRDGWIKTQPQPGPADNQIGDCREIDVDSIEQKMANEGIHWTKSDKSSGSRKIGLQLMRDRLEASIRGEGPGLYFFINCQAAIQTIPCLPRDSDDLDDVDTSAEDHMYDAVRYRVLKGNNRQATSLDFRIIN